MDEVKGESGVPLSDLRLKLLGGGSANHCSSRKRSGSRGGRTLGLDLVSVRCLLATEMSSQQLGTYAWCLGERLMTLES